MSSPDSTGWNFGFASDGLASNGFASDSSLGWAGSAGWTALAGRGALAPTLIAFVFLLLRVRLLRAAVVRHLHVVVVVLGVDVHSLELGLAGDVVGEVA